VAVRHPLDPPTVGEFRQAAAILRRDQGVDDRWRFASIELKEPRREEVRDFEPGDGISREVLVVCWNRDDGWAYKAVVSLTEDRLVSWQHRPGKQPNITVDEYHECDQALHNDPRVAEALAARGITDLDKVLFDVRAYGGALIAERYRGLCVGWTDVYSS
jgi:primary-amine oxidase